MKAARIIVAITAIAGFAWLGVRSAKREQAHLRYEINKAYVVGARDGVEITVKIASGFYTNGDAATVEINRRMDAFLQEEAK